MKKRCFAIRTFTRALIGLFLPLLFPAGPAQAQSCFKFTLISIVGQTNQTVNGYMPYVGGTNGAKMFLALTLSNYVHHEWFADYPNEEPKAWFGSNHMDLAGTFNPTDSQTAGGGTAYYRDWFRGSNNVDYLANDLHSTNTFPTNQWVGDDYSVLETQSGTITRTETNFLNTVATTIPGASWSTFDSIIRYTLSNPLTLANFVTGIGTPPPQATNVYDSPLAGSLICARAAEVVPNAFVYPYGEVTNTTFSGAVTNMTGTVEFETKTNVNYEISWFETDLNGTVTYKTNIVAGTGSKVSVTFFNPGPPTGIGNIEAFGIAVDELGTGGCGTTCGPASAVTPGGPGPILNSARLEMSLGRAGPHRSAGLLRFHESRPRSDMATPSRLAFIGTTNFVTVVTDGSGNLRQALAPQCLADVVTISSNRYDVKFYASTNVGSSTGGVYQVTGTPFLTWTIENPDTTGTNWNQLRVLETRGANVTTNEFQWSNSSQSWTLTSGNG